MSVSQAYFDELCLENEEVFESTREEAVQETVTQLLANHPPPSNDSDRINHSLSHISRTHPFDEPEVRDQITVFMDALKMVREAQQPHAPELKIALSCISEALSDRNGIFSHLYLVEKGFTAYTALLSRLVLRRDKIQTENEIVHQLVSTLSELSLSKLFRRAFQSQTPLAMPAYLELYHQQQFRNLILQIILSSVVQCEGNKKMWMKTVVPSTDQTFSSLLLETLDACSNESNCDIGIFICKILTAVCTFDDFSSTPEEIVMQSGHSNVQTLKEYGAAAIVHKFLIQTENSFAVASLRALAIQDEIVQSMERDGVLETACALLKQTIVASNTVPLLTALIGLFRNMSANDHIKTSLLLKRNIMPHVVSAMELLVKHVTLQEHACGLIAAMALRKPENSMALVREHRVQEYIVRAMEQHVASVTVQRQAALAIRNLVSRSPELRAEMLESNLENALRIVAGKHLGCQDEVYAALRDLGLKANCVHVVEDEMGRLSVQKREMFGECNLKFRPVFENSK